VSSVIKFDSSILCALALIGASMSAAAQEPRHDAGQRTEERQSGQRPERGERRDERAPEAHPGPRGYQRIQEPHGWNSRPKEVDRHTYQHNFRAARSYRIGPYHHPRGWAAHHWGYGEILPRAYWAPEYLISDYWLFALEVPPAGYEWVRDDTDALLVNTDTGEILQVEYGVFG
jgi:Ni/Co efflux regulator RcnB